LAARVNGIAYETILEQDGSLPLLTPMSEVAGRMSVQVGAQYLEKPMGGRGILLGGVPGVAPANVVVLGGGIVGTNAAKMALGLGAHVIIIDKNLNRLRELDDIFNGQVVTLASNAWTIGENLKTADLVIGAVLIPGASAPKLVRREMIATMKRGAVVVDVAIDQGGCFETSRPTSHADPVYEEAGVLHYCVTNIPSMVPRSASIALSHALTPYLETVLRLGPERALAESRVLAEAVNISGGSIVLDSLKVLPASA
jgi:alanine dehydrogenase